MNKHTLSNSLDNVFRPTRILQVELCERLPDFDGQVSGTGLPYERALMLVRLHSQPLGMIALELEHGGIRAENYKPLVLRQFSDTINRHLKTDGLPLVDDLPTGESDAHQKINPCTRAREKALENAPSVGVIIPTRERASQLERCLLSFKALIYPCYELYVVDNCPRTSQTADLVDRLRSDMPMLHYLREERRGVSSARNRGMLEAKQDILAFTDDDAVVDPYWLLELVRGFDAAERVGCVTGLVLPLEIETPAQALFERYGGFNRGYQQRVFDTGKHKLKNVFYPYSVGHCGTGASMAFTREMIQLLGGQDPALGAGTLALAGGDIDSFFQVLMRGYQLVYAPASIIFHEHRRDYHSLRRQVYNYGVGLTAYLTKCLITAPSRIPSFVARIPYGIYNLLASHSTINAPRGEDYPWDLNYVERMGMLYGPLAYLCSRIYVYNENRTRHEDLVRLIRSSEKSAAIEQGPDEP